MMIRAFFEQNISGLHYAVRIFVGSSLLWLLLYNRQSTDSIWAIISLIVVTEPQWQTAVLAFRARVLNTLIGCGTGLIFLVSCGPHLWLLTPVIAISAVISTQINKAQQGWRIAPVTTAIVLSVSMTQHSVDGAVDLALHRTMEVFLGSAVALMVTGIMAFVWPMQVSVSSVTQKDNDK